MRRDGKNDNKAETKEEHDFGAHFCSRGMDLCIYVYELVVYLYGMIQTRGGVCPQFIDCVAKTRSQLNLDMSPMHSR